jgi:PRC-barrel domain
MQAKIMTFGAVTLLATLSASPLFAQALTGPGKTTAPTVTSTGTDATTGAAAPASPSASGNTGGSASAQESYDPSSDARASKVVGSRIYNEQNESLGSLDDILIARDNKPPVRAVISVGGFLGIGNKLVEVDYNRLKFEENNRVVMPNATKDELNKMPSFTYQTATGSTGTTGATGTTGTGSNPAVNTPALGPGGEPLSPTAPPSMRQPDKS